MFTISSTEAARSFSEVLNRVRFRGEAFEIVRGGEAVARLTPVPVSTARWSDLRALFVGRRRDRDFADELERIQANQPKIESGPWDS